MFRKNLKFALLLPVFMVSGASWYHNLDDAQKLAQKEHKYILLNFSGSDWCGPCVRMKKEIFEAPVFKNMADSELVLVNADFPRNKKNQLAPEQQKMNDAMADRYNPQGKFPYTILMNADGKVMGSWEGLPNETPETFVGDIHNAINTVIK